MNKEKTFDREGEKSGKRGACKVCNVKGEKKEKKWCTDSLLQISYHPGKEFPMGLFRDMVNCSRNDLLCPAKIYSGVSRHGFLHGTKVSNRCSVQMLYLCISLTEHFKFFVDLFLSYSNSKYYRLIYLPSHALSAIVLC